MKKIIKEKKYCRNCGFKLLDYTTKKFNEETGKPLIIKECLNSDCLISPIYHKINKRPWLDI